MKKKSDTRVRFFYAVLKLILEREKGTGVVGFF
jgi:hypothetical protein